MTSTQLPRRLRGGWFGATMKRNLKGTSLQQSSNRACSPAQTLMLTVMVPMAAVVGCIATARIDTLNGESPAGTLASTPKEGEREDHLPLCNTDMEAIRHRLRERAPLELGSSYDGLVFTAGFAAQGVSRAHCAPLTGC